jgi:hypothetical protein
MNYIKQVTKKTKKSVIGSHQANTGDKVFASLCGSVAKKIRR